MLCDAVFERRLERGGKIGKILTLIRRISGLP
jgi:hypothetical protein